MEDELERLRKEVASLQSQLKAKKTREKIEKMSVREQDFEHDNFLIFIYM
jgi:hypothetical protein